MQELHRKNAEHHGHLPTGETDKAELGSPQTQLGLDLEEEMHLSLVVLVDYGLGTFLQMGLGARKPNRDHTPGS